MSREYNSLSATKETTRHLYNMDAHYHTSNAHLWFLPEIGASRTHGRLRSVLILSSLLQLIRNWSHMFNFLVQNIVSLRCCAIWRRVGTDAVWKLSPPPCDLTVPWHRQDCLRPNLSSITPHKPLLCSRNFWPRLPHISFRLIIF